MKTNKRQIQSIVLTALEKGFIYTSILCFITTLSIITISSIDSEINSGQNGLSFNEILYGLIPVVLVETILGFLFVSLPTTAIPSAICSIILARWLYSDWQNNKLNTKSTYQKGVLSGIFFSIPISLFWILNTYHRIYTGDVINLLISPSDSFEAIFLRAVIYSPPILGGFVGFRLSGYLFQKIKAEFGENPS